MGKNIRKIVYIDEEKCNGCGECIPSCMEGAITIENGKAKLKAEKLCDGLGACLGTCPMDAIKVIEREADDFSEEAVKKEMKQNNAKKETFGGCPSTVPQQKKTNSEEQLANWPIQLTLVPPLAPFFKDADIVIAADCTAFACKNFGQDIVKGRTLVIACPKLDDSESYVEKLSNILSQNEIKSVTIVHMEVPCCFGLVHVVKTAISNSGRNIPFEAVNISIKGKKL